MPDMSKVKLLPSALNRLPRQRWLQLRLRNLPWGAAPFSIKRYRNQQDPELDLWNNGPGGKVSCVCLFFIVPDTVELLVLTRR